MAAKYSKSSFRTFPLFSEKQKTQFITTKQFEAMTLLERATFRTEKGKIVSALAQRLFNEMAEKQQADFIKYGGTVFDSVSDVTPIERLKAYHESKDGTDIAKRNREN